MSQLVRFHWPLMTLLALALTACGGGGGGDDDDDDDNGGGAPTTFTVSGTVSGLSGSVVLRLNGSNDLTVNAAGAFVFASPLATGATYAVSVATLPSTQVCAIANGAGMIGAANIANVSIACANYSVGGQIAGLTGSGLVLQLNGANDLTVPVPSTSYAFPSSISLRGAGGLANLALYATQIKQQPLGQTCTIVNPNGAVPPGAPNVTIPAITCINNATDALSGTYRLTSLDSVAPTFRAFLTFYVDGTYIFGLHEDNATCTNNGNGLEYGVYRWTQTSHAFAIRTVALDTNGECGIGGALTDTASTLVKNPDGTLQWDATEDDGTPTSIVFTPVPSTTGTLIGSWGGNQAFAAYSSDGKVFSADTRGSTAPNAPARPGIEDGCYTLTGTTSAGSYTFNFGATCTVGTQTAVDTNGAPGGFSPIANSNGVVHFTVTGDSFLWQDLSVTIPRLVTDVTTHTVGGTVTGLTGSVTMRLNGGSDVTLNASGPFTFTTPVLTGANYVVGVGVLPSTQVCAVTANGAGTMSGVNVTNVTVACSAYSISGTVSGQTAAGLVLQLNGANDLAVTAGSGFAFSPSISLSGSGLLAGTALYAVHIKTQPTGQTCTILRSAAIVAIAAPNVANVTVTCVNSGPNALSGTYKVTALSSGPSDDRIFVTFYPDGTYIVGLHSADPDCGPSNGNGVEYGVYKWNQTTNAFQVTTSLDTNGGCGINEDPPSTTFTALGHFTLIKNGNGTLTWTIPGEPLTITLTPVAATTGTLIGSWGGNQSFDVFGSDNTLFSAITNPVAPVATAGVEDGCYLLSGTTTTGSYRVNLTGTCAVSATQTAVDTTGAPGYSFWAGVEIQFTVTGDVLGNFGGSLPVSRIATN